MKTSKPTYQLIHIACNKSMCKPYIQLKRVKDLQKTFLGSCSTEIRKTDFSNLNKIVTIIKQI